ncbi:unnamed protein product [Rotaria socialis]
MYRCDSETFSRTVVHNGRNLLDIYDAGDHGRYARKPELDPNRMQKFKDAIFNPNVVRRASDVLTSFTTSTTVAINELQLQLSTLSTVLRCTNTEAHFEQCANGL